MFDSGKWQGKLTPLFYFFPCIVMVNILAYTAPNGETVLMSAQETQNVVEHRDIVAKLGEEQAATKAGILQTSKTDDMLRYDEAFETD